MTAHPTVLAVLLEDRGLHRYGSFCAAYQQAAGALDKQLADSVPSRAQFHRWLTGELRSLPYTDHCRVLEHMLAGYSAPQLFAPCPDGPSPLPRVPRQASHRAAAFPAAPAAGMAGVVAVFASRIGVRRHRLTRVSLFDSARRVRAAGLSLNLICQQVPDQYLRQWLADGGELSCLFLDPDGEAIRARETGGGPPARHAVRR